MLRKFISIQNVGRFEKYSVRGDLEFRRLNLIYAQNGRGKTTLSHILRSVASGNTSYVNERNTISAGVSAKPEISVLIDDKKIALKGDKWSNTYPNIEIFDVKFVNDNVYTGYYVDVEHKRNLYRFIVGEEGITLSSAIDKLAEDIRSINIVINDKKSDIEVALNSDYDVDEFAQILVPDDIIDQVEKAQKKVAALEQVSQVRSKDRLSHLTLPNFSETSFQTVLDQNLQDLESTALQLVEDHLQVIGKTAEDWIHQGLEIIGEGSECPFCGQNLTGIELIASYQIFFNQEYQNLKSSLIEENQKYQNILSNQNLLSATNTHRANQELVNFWREFGAEEVDLSLDMNEIQKIFNDLATQVQHLLEEKIKKPLETIALSEDMIALFSSRAEKVKAVQVYNASVDLFNKSIDEIKKNTDEGNLEDAKQNLSRLLDQSKRNQPKLNTACEEYLEAKKRKKQLENEKQQKRKELEQYDQNVIKDYETQLNMYLANFGASFSIEKKTKPSYSGGKPSTEYSIKLDNHSIPLGKLIILTEIHHSEHCSVKEIKPRLHSHFSWLVSI